jgi:hypothetical protein
MRILFDESSLRQGSGASRSVTGVLYYEFSGLSFPAEQWRDFPAVIVTWWLEALEKIETRGEPEAVLHFMDGPYWLSLILQDKDALLVKCVEDRPDAGTVHEEYVSLSDFVAQVERLARRIAWACRQQGLKSRDIDVLRRYLPH